MLAPGSLRGSVAVITGASKGIGKAVAREFARLGCDLALVARNLNNLEDVANICNKINADCRVKVVELDVSCKDELVTQRAVDQIAQDLGGINILVNNAGFLPEAASVVQTDMAVLEHVMQTNFYGPVRMSKYCVPYIVAGTKCNPKPNSAIINCSSVSAKTTGGLMTGRIMPYNASKAALSAFSDNLFEDVREHGVKVTALMYGSVQTDMLDKLSGLNKEWNATVDMSSSMNPDTIAKTVAFVATFPSDGCPTEIWLPKQSHGL